jgi:hypothetical protein
VFMSRLRRDGSIFLLCIAVSWTAALMLLGSCNRKDDESRRPFAIAAESGTNATNPDLLIVPWEIERGVAETVPQAAVDVINEKVAPETTSQDKIFKAQSKSPFWIRGWAYDAVHETAPSKIWVELSGMGDGLPRMFIPVERHPRSDIVDGFGLRWALQSGYKSDLLVNHNIPPGRYRLKIYQIEPNRTVLSSFYPLPGVVVVFE